MTVWIVFILMMITNAIGTFAYASRIAGVKMGSINNSGTIYNALTLFSRLSNMFLLPLIGALVENAISSGDITTLTSNFRLFLLASATGTLLAALMIPTMSDLFIVLIEGLREEKSLVKAIRKTFHPTQWMSLIRLLRLPKKDSLEKLSLKGIPKDFLILHIFTSCIYSVGFLSALYAGALQPEYRLVSSNLSSAINGFATIALYLLVDPKFNLISDEVMSEEREFQDLQSTVAALAATRFIGIVLAQLILLPTAHFIVWVAGWMI